MGGNKKKTSVKWYKDLENICGANNTFSINGIDYACTYDHKVDTRLNSGTYDVSSYFGSHGALPFKFLRNGEYIVKTVYGFWKQNNTRNPKYLYYNMGISSYTSEHPLMGITDTGTKGIFTKFNYDVDGNVDSDGLCYNPKKNKNAVPYTFTRYVGVKVINGLAFQLEEAPKNPENFNRGIEWYTINNKNVDTSAQDLCIAKLPYVVNSIAFTNSSSYRDTNITVKYSGDITRSWSIDDFKIRYYDSGLSYSDFFNTTNWILTSELVGFYDGIGNYNDWLFTVLLDFDIYPLKIGDKPFDYFNTYDENIRYYLNFYGTNTMMNLFKTLYNNPLYSKVKEELKKQYPNEDYFELYNTEKDAKFTDVLKDYKESYNVNKLSFNIQDSKMIHYIFNSNPRKEVIDSFITYINKIASRTDDLTYKEIMTVKEIIADFVKKNKTCVSSYTSKSCSTDSDGHESCSYNPNRDWVKNSKLICYKRCKQEELDTLYYINGSYDYGYDIWKKHNPNIDKSEWNKHKNDEFFINDIINNFVDGLSSGYNEDSHPEADTYYFDMAWITHGIPLK